MQAVAMVAVIAITLGTVGSLLMSRSARNVSHQGPVTETRYTVTTILMAAKDGPIRACWGAIPTASPTGCEGVDVTNVDLASMNQKTSFRNGTVQTGTVKLVGTWDGHSLHLTEQPRLPPPATYTLPEPIARAGPGSSRKTPQEVVQELARDNSTLRQRGILVLAVAEMGGFVRVFLAVADAKSVKYLTGTYGPLEIYGWLQPVDAAKESPLPSPTPSQIYLPQTAQLSAPSANVVWAFFAQGLLFRSTDRGNTWAQRRLPPNPGGGSPREISFVDEQNGWYSIGGVPESQCNAAGTEVWRTTDAGSSWQRIAFVTIPPTLQSDSGFAPAQCKEGLSFIDAAHGFLGAWDPNHKPTIYRTSDAGRSWKGSTLPDPPGFVTQAGGISLRVGLVKAFGSTLLAPASSGQGEQYVFRSTDGGATWNFLAKGGNGSVGVTFASATRWLRIGNDASETETTDAGTTWHAFANDYRDAAGVASVFVFGSDLVGYGTVRGGIHRTQDGGLHWVKLTTPGTTEIPTTHPPLPAQTATWPSYSSAEYGYSLRYSPRWFDVGSLGIPRDHYFSNKKDDSPLMTGPDEVLAGMSADCLSGISAGTVINESNVVVDTLPSVRYFVEGTATDGLIFAAVATVRPGSLCYRISMIARTQKAIEANLADFDLMLETVRFSPRTAPVAIAP
jgi:photosystem II stability/assembly factor-like uncharacterized protein